MKNIFRNITYILFIGICSLACTDLDEDLYDKLPKDNFGKTEEQMNAIVGPAYRSLEGLMSYDTSWGMASITADVMIIPTRYGGDWWDGGMFMEQSMHSWHAKSPAIENLWNSCMKGVTYANSIYALVEESTILSPDLKKRYLAELRGLRAFWYYQLVDYFGNVPLVTDFKDESLPIVTPRAQIYKFIVDELNAILPDLRSDVGSESYGKFTQGAARAVLAKMYLNAAEWVGTANWQGVIDQCDEIMEMDYVIEPNWKASFVPHNENSKEIIFPICFRATDWGNNIHLYTLHYNDPIALGFKAGTWNGVCAMPDFVNEFDDADLRKKATFLIGPMKDPKTGKVLETEIGRPLNHTIELNIIPETEKELPDGTKGWGEVHQEEGARIQKWEFEKGMINTSMENDVAIFRLADIHLMKAEALVRIGRSAEGLSLVNKIRERAFGNTSHNLTALTLNDIYKERRLELAYEFTERQDMIRFGTFLKPKFLKPKTSPEYCKLLPIPFKAWQKNNKLTQNPGYSGF